MASNVIVGNQVRKLIWPAAVYSLLTVLAIVFATPLLWLVSTSLKDDSQMALWPPVWIPVPIRWKNFWTAWTAGNFSLYLLNTAIITIGAMIGQLFTASVVLHDRFGLLNETLFQVFNVIGPNWLTSPTWSKPSLVIWSLWGIGSGMIIYLAGLQGVPEVLYEAAALDGAGALRRFWRITLPMISPTIFFVLILGIIGSFQIFTPVFLLGGTNYGQAAAGPMDSLLFWVVYIYHQGFFYFRMGYASALAWLLFIILMILTFIQFRLAKRWGYYEDEAAR